MFTFCFTIITVCFNCLRSHFQTHIKVNKFNKLVVYIDAVNTIRTKKEDPIYLRLPFTNNTKTRNNNIHSINQKLNIKITQIYTCNKSKDLFKTKSCDNDAVRSSVVYKYTCDICQKM